MKKILLFLTALLSSIVSGYSQEMPNYVEKEIWNDSWPIYASEYYNGKLYVTQLYRNDNGWEMRLIEINMNSDATLSDPGRHWILDSGKNKNPEYKNYNAAMEVYDGKLYIYIYCNSQNYFHSFVTDTNNKATLTRLECPVQNNKYYAFAMTTYRNALMIMSLKNNSRGYGILEAVFTYDNPNNPKDWKTVTSDREFFEVPQKSFDNEHEFDIVPWTGVREVTVEDANGNQSKEMRMVEELIIGQYSKSGNCFYVNHFTGNPEELGTTDPKLWGLRVMHGNPSTNQLVISNRISPEYGVGFGLKIVEGQIAGVGSAKDESEVNNPLQFIMGFKKNYVTGNIHQRQIICYEYDPAKRTFHNNTSNATYNFATNLPYGKFAACSVSVPLDGNSGNIVKTYQRYISIFSGAFDSHFNKHHYYAMMKSNQIRVTKSYLSTDSLMKSDKGRRVCTLVGVIEGAPPTVADNAEMYKTLCGHSGNLSSLEIGQEETNKISTQNSMKTSQTYVAGYDGYSSGGMFGLSVMAGGGMELSNTFTDDETFTRTHTTGFDNSDASMARMGFYYYIVPQFDEYNGMVYTPDGKRLLSGCGGVVTYRQTGFSNQFLSYYLDDKEIDPRIRIENPLRLEDWAERGEKILAEYGVPGIPFLDHESVNAITNSSYTLKTTKSHATSTTKTTTWDLDLKTHVFQHKSGGNITLNTTSSTTLGKDIKISIKRINKDDLELQERENPVQYYNLTGYFLNDKESPFTKLYYDDLIKRGMMDENDTPFILAWSVSGISGSIFGINASGVEEIDGNDKFNVRTCPGGVKIECTSPQFIEIFNISGNKVFSHKCQEEVLEVVLSPGLYIVKNNCKSIKILIK